MKTAIYQMQVVPGKPEENMLKISEFVRLACESDKPDVVVLPEMWTTSYTLKEIHLHADEDGKQVVPFLQTLAKSYDVNIVGGSFANKVGGKVYNTAVVVDRKGTVVYKYDKVHLVPMLQEPDFLEGGQAVPEVFELDGVKAGVIICYDLRFPELIRPLALEDAEVLFIVAEWPEARINHWKTLQIARAIENQMFVVSANSVGTYDGVTYGGTSLIIDPWGEVLAEGGMDEGVLEAEFDVKLTMEVREKVPVFTSRVPHLYKSHS
ncbi:carbon-nitrogen family hydrolase [Chungangia koreensis]|uniref:Carbon-nitrogen family hydrolase n=1 Tax=Chungangia koreensis TaxID=752657 RepID=A0ABV8X3J5_9LACT